MGALLLRRYELCRSIPVRSKSLSRISASGQSSELRSDSLNSGVFLLASCSLPPGASLMLDVFFHEFVENRVFV